MYEELVKSLRVCGRMTSIDDNCISYVNGCCEAFPDCAYALMDQAADAIEQLSNVGSAYGRGWTLGYDAGREESKPRWIPVTERLPEIGKNVLCYCRANIYEVMSMQANGGWMGDGVMYMSSFVTHWMPLPERPEEE